MIVLTLRDIKPFVSVNQYSILLATLPTCVHQRDDMLSFFFVLIADTGSDQLFAGYIGEFTIVDDHRSGKIVIQLNGRLNKTGVISPRFNVQHSQIESWVNLLLPARSFGYIILTTSSGILDHEEARRKNVGGKLLGYVY